MGGSWSVTNRKGYSTTSKLVQDRQCLILFYLPLPLLGEVQVMCESSSMWITSPATSFVISGLDFSSRWNSPLHCVSSPIYHTFFMLHTLNDVHDSRAKEMPENGMAGVNCTEPCHQVVRFVGWAVFIEPVDLQVVVIIVRDALEASFRSCDVLQCDNSRQCVVFNDQDWKLKHQESTHSVRHVWWS